MKNKIRAILLLIVVSICIAFSFTYNDNFSDIVVFYPQHEDDETLWASSAILEAINHKGKENVYIVLVSDGRGISVFDKKKYMNLTEKEKYNLRKREFLAALKDLGVKRENIILLPEISSKEDKFTLMRKTALNFEHKYKNVTHIAHSYIYDSHSEHLKNGQVIQQLYKEKKIKHALYYVKPQYENYIDNDKKIVYKTRDKYEREKIKRACIEYKFIDENQKREGIGYQSDHKSFDRLVIINKSILHTPNV